MSSKICQICLEAAFLDTPCCSQGIHLECQVQWEKMDSRCIYCRTKFLGGMSSSLVPEPDIYLHPASDESDFSSDEEK